jgi:TPR repeat protein/peptidoglycan hydrolase-like protein with peptidoglycan-binding domain
MTGTPDWRSSTLLAATAVAMALAGLLAFATIDPPPLPVRRAKTPTVAEPIAAPIAAPKIDVVLPIAEPPPAVAGLDFDAKPPAPPTPPAAAPSKPTTAADWSSLPVEDLRTRANAKEIAAMEELARRLIEGIGVAKDPQAGAGWLLRAAEAGSPQAAFNVGVIYERGFVVERDSTRAVEWYRKAANANVPAAKHNLALLLRDGKGAPRDGKQAIELLRAAARQGMAASMFSLGDIYDRGDAGPRDPATALAWFAIAAEFERQINHDEDTPLAKTAQQRAQSLQRVLTPAELERAQQTGQNEFRKIAEALAPPKPASPPVEPAPPAMTAAPSDEDLPSWPKTQAEQVRAVQQALADLQLLRDRPDGMLGPMTRNAIRDFQRSVGLRDSGEPSKEVYLALRQALGQRDIVANSPLPLPAKIDPPASAPPKPEPPAPAAPQVAAKPEPPPAPAIIDLGKPEPPPAPPTTADLARALPKVDPPKPTPPAIDPTPPPRPRIDIAKPDPPPPPTSADLARAPASTDADAWPMAGSDQVKAIQGLLRYLKILREPANGQNDAATQQAIREYEGLAGLKETGEPSKALFDSLKEMRALMAPKSRPN